jgi:hypothetical protein
VPETTVYKESYPVLSEHKVGFSKRRPPSAPATETVFAEETDERQLGLLVPVRTNAGHHFGAFRSRKYIGHAE